LNICVSHGSALT